jgi:pimeloyl-ACP methyl ester carboxylesterase
MPTIHANGINIAYECAGEGVPLLFITGLGYGGWFWHKQVAELSREFQVITFDNRGSGGTDKPDGPYATAQMAQDAAGLLDGLGIARAHVVGHSLGGFIAQELALARPDLVQQLVLASTSFGGANAVPITPQALAVMMERSGDPAALVRRGIGVAAAPGFAERDPEMVEALIGYRLSGPVPAAQYHAQMMAGATHNAEERIHAITAPTLVLFGEHDQVVPPANAQLLTDRIPNARSRILPGVGHIFPLEDPAATNRVLREFFVF